MRERQDLLSKVGHNTNLLPDDAVEVDLLTDSWSEIGLPEGEEEAAAREQAIAPSEEILRGLYGYKHFVTVFRGRFAEAILARSLADSRGIVLSNGLFPTTRFHMESSGFDVRELPSPDAYDPRSDAPFKGDLDLEALKKMLSGREAEKIKAVYLELCVNALGGHPVSIANLRAVREMTSGRGILMILDATRAFENAVLIQEREPGYADKPLARIVRELCSHSDCTASSCTKDFKTAVGGFVGTNDAAHSTRIGDLTLAFGDGLSGGSREALRRALWRFAEWNLASVQRVATARRLWEALRRLSVPVVAPAGGYGVFVDVRAFLPHIPPGQYPTQALANALFVASGVRASGNLGTPEQARRGIELLRLAVPIARYSEDALRPVIAAFEALVRNPDRVRGLKRSGGPPGMIGQFAAFYRPVPRA
jgi:tyrosine phenol-lyase